MSMTFNQFQRELQNRNIDAQTAYMLTLIYERFAQLAKEHELMAQSIAQMADNMQQFVTLREDDRKRLMEMQRKISGRSDGIDVFSESVLDDPSRKN